MTIPRSHPRPGALTLAAASALAVAFAAPAVHAAPSAHVARAKKCDISKVATSLGPTQVTSLKVSKVTCDNGISVVRAFHKCRLEHGTSGRCVKLVKGYACIEERHNAGPQFTAKVTCKKKKKSVVHNYTQAT
jgi:hypothetical protein